MNRHYFYVLCELSSKFQFYNVGSVSLTNFSVNSDIAALLINLDAISNDFFTASINAFLVDSSINFLVHSIM